MILSRAICVHTAILKTAYDPKNGRRQNSWSKNWYRSDRSELEQRRKMNIDIRDNNRKSDIREYKKVIDVLGYRNVPISFAKFQ